VAIAPSCKPLSHNRLENIAKDCHVSIHLDNPLVYGSVSSVAAFESKLSELAMPQPSPQEEVLPMTSKDKKTPKKRRTTDDVLQGTVACILSAYKAKHSLFSEVGDNCY
jgi:hypothetical protein